MEVLDSAGKKVTILGNEAIVRGALESGVGFVSTYPGTPTTEIGDLFSKIAKDVGIYFEYSTNEKVAVEAAAGAALSGVRSLVFFKNFGLNVACDSIFPLAYSGIKAGMVIVVSDDPQCWNSGQSEEDTRPFAKISHLPMLEPSNAQECKDFVKKAFKLSEKFKLPVLIRTTGRVNYMESPVKLEEITKGRTKGRFKKNIVYRNLPPFLVKIHRNLHKKLEDLKRASERSEMNFLVNNNTKSKLGIIVSGISFDYVTNALDNLKLKTPILKIGFTYPLPDKKIKSFIKGFESILVVEELEPIIEEKVSILAKESNPKLKILGKSHLPISGEYDDELITNVLAKISGKIFGLIFHKKIHKKIIPSKERYLCAGCPHRATFYATKLATAGMDVVYGGDIGCYILGVRRPLKTQDFMFSMGASEGVVHGIKKTTDQKAIAFIGDSTFFHAGIPALINIVYNKSNPLIMILDNRTAASTGYQPTPGIGITGTGEKTKMIKIEDIVKACGVKNVKVVDSFNVKKMANTIKDFLNRDKISVIVARRECQLLAIKKKKMKGIKIQNFEIDQKICNKCGKCLKLGCPAIIKKGNNYRINQELCTGCGVCAQICSLKAIKMKK
jgi:indolepyruvate ferredoxin oxidoreductase alpha subunit